MGDEDHKLFPPYLSFMALGILGASTYIVMWAKSFQDLLCYGSFRHIAVGAIVGLLYWILYSNYGFPNFIMCFVAGYMGPDFLEAIIEKMKPKPPGGS